MGSRIAGHHLLILLLGILLVIPLNIYVIGDWLGAGVQTAFVRYLVTAFGPSLISSPGELSLVVTGILSGRSAVSAILWFVGSTILGFLFILSLARGRDILRSRRILGISLLTAGGLYLLALIFQYGVLFRGPSGMAIPIGIPLVLASGFLVLRGWPGGEAGTAGTQPETTATREWLQRGYAEPVLVFILLFLAYNTVTGLRMSGDTIPAMLLPWAILKYHTFALDPFPSIIVDPNVSYAFQSVNGHYFSIFPIVTPILVLPLYLVPWAMVAGFQIPLNLNLMTQVAKFSASVIAALAGLALYMAGRELFSRRVALITTFIFAFATSTWSISSQALWQHGVTELLLALLVLLVIRNERYPSLPAMGAMGVLSGLFLLNRPPDAVLLLPVIWYVVTSGRRNLKIFGASLLIGAAPFLAFNLLVFHNIFGGYGANLAFLSLTPEIPIRFLGFLVAPNMGLLVFSPVLVVLSLLGYRAILSLPHSIIRDFLVLFGPVCLLTILVYSLFSIWVGAAYGPRYLTGILPILSLYCGFFLNRTDILGGRPEAEGNDGKHAGIIVLVLLLIGISVCIHAVGVFYYPYIQDIGMDEKRVWDSKDLTILRSLHDGGERMNSIRVLSYPPLPPLLSFAWRPGRPVSLLNESIWQTENLSSLTGNPTG